MIRKQTMLWTTKDGRKLRICDMGNSHLGNCIQVLRRRKKEILSKVRISASLVTGELEQSEMDAVAEILESSDIEQFRHGRALLLELERRGLKT